MYAATTKTFGLNRATLGLIICALAATFYCYESLLRVVPSVMSVQLMQAYHLGPAAFANLVACYYYIYAPMQLPVGMLMDRFGPRRLLSFAGFNCVIGMALMISSDQVLFAEIGRMFVGFGSAFAFVGVLKLGTVWLAPEKFAILAGSTMSLGMIGALTSNLLITQVIAYEGWRLSIYHATLFGAALTGLIFLFVRDVPKGDCVKEIQLSTHEVITRFKALISHIDIWKVGVIGCLIWLPLAVFAETWGIKYLQDIYHFSPAQASFANSMVFLGWATGGPCVGVISNYLSQRRLPIMIGTLVSAVCISVVLYGPIQSSFLITLLLFGFGLFSSVQVLVFPIGREISGKASSGTAIALVNMFVMFSGVIAPISGVVLGVFSTTTTGVGYPASAYQVTFSMIPASLVLAALVCAWVGETYGQDGAEGATKGQNGHHHIL